MKTGCKKRGKKYMREEYRASGNGFNGRAVEKYPSEIAAVSSVSEDELWARMSFNAGI